MSNEPESSSLLYGLTKPKGALLAVPALLGAALLFSVVAGGDRSVASDQAANAKTVAEKAGAKGGAKEVSPNKGASLVNLAAAEKPATTGTFSSAQRDEIGEIVRSYLLKNPRLLEEVSEELRRLREDEQQKNQAKMLVSEKQSIFRSPHDYVLGNPKGDVTVVEYFDYNCGWCKRALNEVAKLAADDKNVRVVMKEFPIFGEHSTFAAKAALASLKQNKYWEFHTALMKAERVTRQNTMDIAKSVGIDVDALKQEMQKSLYDKVIAENTRVAQALGMQGTPGFIVDSKVNFGYVPADGLKTMLSEVRKEGCKVC